MELVMEEVLMSARDYPVWFGYGAFDGTYYTRNASHRGNDRACPEGTPLIIGSTVIGRTGNTGWTSGAHLHTQAGYDEWCQQTVDPTPYDFQPGTVVHTGNASQWGNYIIIRTDSGIYICYAHLSAIYAHDGQRVNGATNQSTGGSVDTIKSMYWRLMGREADQGGIDTYSQAASSKGWDFVYNDLKNSAEGQADWERRNPERVTQLEHEAAKAGALQDQLNTVTAQLVEVKQALANEQAKPPKEVIKVVEKIVEKPVEVLIPAPAQDEQQVVQGWFARLWQSLFKK